MTIEIWQALLIGCVAALTALEGDFLGECKLREPLVTGFLVGLILGDVRQGIIIGGQLQLIWMGATGIGLSAQLDIGCGGTIGTAIALMTNSGAEVAMAFGLPVSILMQSLNVLKMTGFSGIMHKVDRYAEEGNMKGMIRLHYFCGFITFLLYCVPTFVSVYMGSGLVQTVVDSLPQWAMDGLTAVSALLPALGFAMLLQILMETKLIPFFIVGFVVAAYTDLTMLAITLLAVAVALVMYWLKSDRPAGTLAYEEEEDL